jgi:pyrroloquinoline quinone (PQQ) biosynthesis protein C
MDYNKAVDVLAGPPIIKTMAEALGVSENTVSQTRLASDARRPPPKGWKAVVRDLALERAAALSSLASELADA